MSLTLGLLLIAGCLLGLIGILLWGWRSYQSFQQLPPTARRGVTSRPLAPDEIPPPRQNRLSQRAEALEQRRRDDPALHDAYGVTTVFDKRRPPAP